MQASDVVDGLIAIVLVLLLLSLMLQSVQELIKRLLRIKARQLEKAISALFQKVGLDSKQVTPEPRKEPQVSGGAQWTIRFFEDVARDFGRTGTFLSNRSAAEEVSKKELMLWLSGQLVGASLTELADAVARVEELLDQSPEGDAGPPFASLQAKVRPFLSSLPRSPEDFTFERAKLLPMVTLDPVMEVIAKLRAMPDPPARLDQLPRAITEVLEAWRRLSSPAIHIQNSVEAWFDTTMVAFTERYNREMKRWSLGLGSLLVLAFNANLFTITRDAFSSSVRRDLILKNEAAIKALTKEKCEELKTDPEIVACVQRQIAKGQELAAGLGLKLVTPDDVSSFWQGLWQPDGLTRLPGQLIGWLLTALLLSVGAPFWQDALQSLFGLKTLLRKPAPETSIGRIS